MYRNGRAVRAAVLRKADIGLDPKWARSGLDCTRQIDPLKELLEVIADSQDYRTNKYSNP